MRILGVDPGEKRIGLALSDPTGTIANPLQVLKHVSRLIDAAVIVQTAVENDVRQIVIGYPLDPDNISTPGSRRAARLAGAIRTQTDLPVILWDEYRSTQSARQARLHMGTSRRKRGGHLDELAATVILQTYLDAHKDNPESE